MALGITASLVGIYSPRTVQVVVTGLTVGQDYTVVGDWSGGTWQVRAGTGIAADTQVLLSDVATPINTPITYTVTSEGSTATSAELTVDYRRRYVLQSLAGDISVEIDLGPQAPRTMNTRQSVFTIPGRSRPVVFYDIAGGESGQLTVDTEAERTVALKALLQTGAPILLRTDGAILDLEPVAFLAVTGASSSMVGMFRRRWQLDYQLVDDPEPAALVGLPTWDQFDASYSALTFANFDAEWAGSTWDQLDTYDWATRAAS